MTDFSTKQLATDAIEMGGGFLFGGFAGRYVENIAIKTPVTPTSSFIDKLIAGAANNAPKVALYYILNKANSPKIAGAILANGVIDILLRATNQGVDPLNVNIAGYRILDKQLFDTTEALRAFSSPEVERIQRKYQSMQDETKSLREFSNPEDRARQVKYQSMPFQQYSDKNKRERKYGFAGKLSENKTANLIFNMK